MLLSTGGEMGAGKLMLAGKSAVMGKARCRLHNYVDVDVEHPFKGGGEVLLVASCYRNCVKL